QERLAGWPVLERDQRVDGISIDAAAEAVNSFRRIGEHAPRLDLVERASERAFHLLTRPERNRECLDPHSRSGNIASARAKSDSVVIFIARSLPATTWT